MDSPLLQAPDKKKRTEGTNEFVSLPRPRTSTSDPEVPRRSRGSDHKLHAAISIALHSILILVHAILTFVYLHHYERRLIVVFTDFTANWLPTAVTTISQLIGTVNPGSHIVITSSTDMIYRRYTLQFFSSLLSILLYDAICTIGKRSLQFTTRIMRGSALPQR